MGFCLWFAFLLIIFAFICEYMDSTLGMGYGTTLTPVLLIMGYEPLQIVPVILVSELITGLLAALFHHMEGNVNFMPEKTSFSEIAQKLKHLGYLETFKRDAPLHLKVALILGVCSVIGTITAVFIAVNIPKLWIKLYIGFLVLSMGIFILICLNKSFKFSWKKIIGLGLLASFNKGVSGGGYGPVVTSGQILSGVESKSAIGITSLAEGLTCAVGIIAYILVSKRPLDMQFALFIITGAVLSVPFSVKSVKAITEKRLKLAIAVLTIVLGIFTLYKVLKP
ncbi:MAG: sulfite exporter TauE/SafE family protein [Candidatus Omnitrophica bacterium]|nr:sulfite exporter TauE/SafE family protein [Candidatus Omnitrophota bacterium]